MVQGFCHICQRYRELYCSYPKITCVLCCDKLPVRTILEMMDITYHEAIRYTHFAAVTDDILDTGPLFWCTMDNNGMFQRCGIVRDEFKLVPNGNFSETRLIIITSYCDGTRGQNNMKKFKQNFRRIRKGQQWERY